MTHHKLEKLSKATAATKAHMRAVADKYGIDINTALDWSRTDPWTIGYRLNLVGRMRDTKMPGGKRCSWPQIAAAIGYAGHAGARKAYSAYRRGLK